jgi:hypothetical protein
MNGCSRENTIGLLYWSLYIPLEGTRLGVSAAR